MSEAVPKGPPQRSRNLGVAFLIIGLFLVGAVVIFYLSNAQEKASRVPDSPSRLPQPIMLLHNYP